MRGITLFLLSLCCAQLGLTQKHLLQEASSSPHKRQLGITANFSEKCKAAFHLKNENDGCIYETKSLLNNSFTESYILAKCKRCKRKNVESPDEAANQLA